ncbi:PAS domain-containing sensor histidine kinase [Massilia arenosa]|uniref:histidine kinase n=1 Tax=Zemynaea arenosa TaxID=2561931 RepID=A0A4Y9SQK4_9BURK|nr:PAS domain-containing sensor histidine kinase [Massilia arenosa]TFW26583.1 PAS domain-containing sensor histidine kinase [Massilia arenosa]
MKATVSRPALLAGPWRWLVPGFLVVLLIVVMLVVPWQARQMESGERQEQLIADTLWVEQTIRFELDRNEEALNALAADVASGRAANLHERLVQLLRNGNELRRVAWVDETGHVVTAAGQAHGAAVERLAADLALARDSKRNLFMPPSGARMDFHVPVLRDGHYLGSLVATYDLPALLAEMVPWWFAHENQVTLTDRDEKLLARRAAAGPGRGVYTHKHAMDLPGATLILATDSVKSAPLLLPNVLVGSVVALALCLLLSLAALWRHIHRRLAAEVALRQQMAFRTAMENSLVTGLRARDLEGRVTYVNPAFCQIVGLPAEEIVGRAPPMPYWAPEAMAEYEARFAGVLAGHVTPQFETVFKRADGARVPVLIFEAPLIDSEGRQTGWMGSVLDISERKRAEELARQQQEKLQASARLATMGEISSMLAHELNQPLAAISSYTTGALNMIEREGDGDRSLLRRALEQASAQAQRAGQIIRSVHDFVRKRGSERQLVQIGQVIDGIRALVEMQAKRLFVVLETVVEDDLPPVLADRVMIEQVLLNLTRNGIEAMAETEPATRILRIEAVCVDGGVEVRVADHGSGIPEDVAARLFSPFFSTKAEGMGMGLSICRTAVEFHGGAMTFAPNPRGGTIFSFTLPALATVTQ